MAKDLRTFLEDVKAKASSEFVTIDKQVDPANYDITAIIKHLQEKTTL